MVTLMRMMLRMMKKKIMKMMVVTLILTMRKLGMVWTCLLFCFIHYLLEAITLLGAIREISSEDPNKVFSKTKIKTKFSRISWSRIRTIVPHVLRFLRKRGLIVKVYHTSIYRLIDTEAVSFETFDNLLSLNVLSHQQLRYLELRAILARICLSLRSNNPSRSMIMRKIKARYRDRFLPVIDDFLHFLTNQTCPINLNGILCILREATLGTNNQETTT